MEQRNENYGRDQNIYNQPGTVVINQPEQPRRPHTEQHLLKRVEQEVDARLSRSLHNALQNVTSINLGKEVQADQVRCPWALEVKIGARPAEPIAQGTEISDVFKRPDIGGRLLILGKPGSGKTTTMLDLAKWLINKAQTDVSHPIPVLFNLSLWQDNKQSIRHWLILRLEQQYGIRQDISENLLREYRLLPLLDGLDEVKPERQELCVHSINQFLTNKDSPSHVVVCSRYKEYNHYETKLQLNGAIYLKLLTLPQIQDYLKQVSRLDLWDFFTRNANLLELVQVPLFLSTVILAYPKESFDQWQQINSSQEWLDDLWDRYICSMFERELRNNPYSPRTEPSQKQARRWLIWLARQMERESQTEFSIERMQPTWLQSKGERRFYQISVWLVLGSMFGLMFNWFWGVAGLLVGVLVGILLFRQVETIEPAERLEWNLKYIKYSLSFKKARWIDVLVAGLVGALMAFQISVLNIKLLSITALLLTGLSVGLSTAELSKTVLPNQGIRNSARSAVLVGLGSGVLFGLPFELPHGILFGLIIGLILGFYCGGKACLQHFALRWVLYNKGYIPWNYARFLDYASERLLLQRVGGRYRFIHKLLQEHLAALPFDQ